MELAVFHSSLEWKSFVFTTTKLYFLSIACLLQVAGNILLLIIHFIINYYIDLLIGSSRGAQMKVSLVRKQCFSNYVEQLLLDG